MLARAGAPVTLIGRPKHVEAFRRSGLRMDTTCFQETVPLSASADIAAARGAQLILFCVKSIDSEPVAQSLAPHLAPDALILDLQNGVDNVPRICRQVPNPVVASVVYVACEMIGAGCVKHHGRPGRGAPFLHSGRPAAHIREAGAARCVWFGFAPCRLRRSRAAC